MGRPAASLIEHLVLYSLSYPPPWSCGTYSSGGCGLKKLGVSTGGVGAAGGREPYPIAELLSLLAAFTFAQRSTQGLQRCLQAWAAFVAQATVGEGEGTAGETLQTMSVVSQRRCCCCRV